MKQRAIELHIQELVLHGFAPGDRFRIADAVERELIRSFAEHGLPPSMRRTAVMGRVDGGAFTASPNAQADGIGSQVGQSVYEGLRR